MSSYWGSPGKKLDRGLAGAYTEEGGKRASSLTSVRIREVDIKCSSKSHVGKKKSQRA